MADIEKLMVVGSGGREFALIQEARDEGIKKVYSTRDEDSVNFGIEGVINTGLGEDVKRIGSFASQEEIDLVIVGPESPLVNGLADVLRHRGVPVYGPGADGAKFEADKTITHRFVEKYGLPNPDNSASFTTDNRLAAKEHVTQLGPENIYTKRVGLEGGKGSKGYGPDELERALREIDRVADKGEDILIQGRLLGPEYSVMYMFDGNGNIATTALSRDHKALRDNGLGPNTGGMGSFAPLSLEQATFLRRQQIGNIGQLINHGLQEELIDYRGTVYAGLMAENQKPDSQLRILEFNVRFGDPETQVLLKLMGGKAIEYMNAAANGAGYYDLSGLYLDPTNSPVCLTVCLASPGYPDGQILKGLPVHLPRELPSDISIQFAGAKMVDDKVVSSGGRVAYITATSSSVEEARGVYDYIGLENAGLAIGQDQQLIRTDIGLV